MNKQEALKIARREVSNTELNLCRAQKRNATQGEMDGLKRNRRFERVDGIGIILSDPSVFGVPSTVSMVPFRPSSSRR